MRLPTKTRQRTTKKVSSSELIRKLRANLARLRSELRRLKARSNGSTTAAPAPQRSVTSHSDLGDRLPELPTADSQGYYPATETIRIILARQIIRRRHAAGWTQAQLAKRARVRQETISRLETGKHAPNVTTVDKINMALREAGV